MTIRENDKKKMVNTGQCGTRDDFKRQLRVFLTKQRFARVILSMEIPIEIIPFSKSRYVGRCLRKGRSPRFLSLERTRKSRDRGFIF